MTDYEIYLNSLDELRLAKPYSIQDALIDDSLVLAGIDDKVDQLLIDAEELKGNVEHLKQFLEENKSYFIKEPKKKSNQ